METIAEAKAYLKENHKEGTSCPCCGQFVKMYSRKITSTDAYGLITFYRHAGTTFQHAKNLFREHVPKATINDGGTFAKLRHYQLIESAGKTRDDGGHAGIWRVTPLGESFVKGEISIKSKVLLYNGKCYGVEGDNITIQGALRNKFNYNELMGIPEKVEVIESNNQIHISYD